METKKNISKARELEIIQELRSGNGYFADTFSASDFDSMSNNIRDDFPLLHGTRLVEESEYERVQDSFNKQVEVNKELRSTIDSLIDKMLVSVQEYSDTKLLNEVIALKGDKYVIRRKISLNLPLWPSDLDYIMNNL
jgi:hypothetical protein